jgi:hypothetical protein
VKPAVSDGAMLSIQPRTWLWTGDCVKVSVSANIALSLSFYRGKRFGLEVEKRPRGRVSAILPKRFIQDIFRYWV